MISVQTSKRLHAIKEKVERIVGKPISYDQIVNIILSTKGLDEELSDLLLERGEDSD